MENNSVFRAVLVPFLSCLYVLSAQIVSAQPATLLPSGVPGSGGQPLASSERKEVLVPLPGGVLTIGILSDLKRAEVEREAMKRLAVVKPELVAKEKAVSADGAIKTKIAAPPKPLWCFDGYAGAPSAEWLFFTSSYGNSEVARVGMRLGGKTIASMSGGAVTVGGERLSSGDCFQAAR